MAQWEWKPVLEGEASAQAAGLTRTIGSSLIQNRARLASAGKVGLASGIAGDALLFAYLDRAFPGEGWGAEVFETVRFIFDAMADSASNPSLADGLLGISWLVEHLRDDLSLEEDPNDSVDDLLDDLLREPEWRGDFDLLHGLSGIGVRALERMRSSPISARRHIERVVEHLERAARPAGSGVVWFRDATQLPPRVRARHPRGYYDLGVAHGMSGVIGLLAAIHDACIGAKRSFELAQGGLQWLLGLRLPDDQPWGFPEIVAEGGAFVSPDGPVWCRGDPATSLVLYSAAQRMGDRAAEREVIEIARRGARYRRSDASSKAVGGMANEVCFCHGAAGVGHIYGRLFGATGEPVFADAARHWLEWTVGAAAAGEPLASAGLLDGAAGVGLALLSAATGVEPAWDSVLLLSPFHGAARRDEQAEGIGPYGDAQ